MTTKTAKRFQVGQEIFQVSEWSETQIGDRKHNRVQAVRVEYRVHSRIVDACGKKQITFVERDERKITDYVLGRRHDADSCVLFATKDEAFAEIARMIEEKKSSIADRVAREPEWFGLQANNEYFVNQTVFVG
jgi:hypothetical protein